MRKATENQGNTRTFAEYFSPRSKVKDFELQQQHPPPHFMSYHHETPMKPSQVPNRLSQPPPRRVLPLQSPEMCHRDRLGQQWHPPHHLGPIHSTEFTVGGPTNMGSPTNRPYHMPRDRQGPPQHCVQPPGLYGSSHFVPVSQPDLNTSATILQPFSPGIYHNPAPQFMRDLSNHTSSFHMRAEQVAKPKVTFTYSGSKNVTAKSQEPNKVQSNDFGSPIPTVQLHRPPMAINPRASQEIYLRPVTESEPWSPDNSHWSPQSYQPLQSNHTPERINVSSLPIMHSPVAPYQDQQHKKGPSSERFTPVMDLYGSSQKRHRDFQDSYSNAKKLCPESANSDKAQTPKPTVCTSVSASPSSSIHSSVSDLLPETTDRNLCTDLACGQSKCSELSSTFKPTQSSSLSPKLCLKRKTSRGAKQVYVNSSQNPIVNLNELKSPSRPVEECLRRRTEEIDKRNKSRTLLSPVVLQRDTSSLPHVQLSSQHSGHADCSTSVSTLSRGSHGEKSRKTDISTPKSVSKPNTDPRNCRTAERNKTGRLRRPVVPSYDIAELFTPDPIVSPPHKTAKPKVDGGLNKSPSSGRSCLSSDVNSSSSSVTGSSSRKTPHAVDSTVSSSEASPQILLPTIALERVKLENLMSLCPKNSPSTSSGRQLKEGSVKSDEKHSSLLPNNVTSVIDTAASVKSSASKCHSQSVPLERQASEGGRKQVIEEDPIDVELDLGLSFALDLDSAQSSHSSEEEQLLSLQEMMDRVAKPPETPEKGAFSEPSTPGVRSSQIKIQPLTTSTKPGLYKNSLDQMLKEINTNKKAKEIETQLLTACKEDLLRIAEYEAAEENQEAGISTEQQEFLQRYSLMSNAIREVPPGEVVFNLEKFGQIFNEITLQLRQCMANPQGTAQKTLLWSSPAQLRLHVNIGLFQEAYDCRSPCPTQVTRFLFKMMSVHSDRMLSEKILQALCDIACTAAYQIVKNGSQQFKVWVPSLADVTLVLMNMGVAFVTLFPFENLQPSFTEGDLLEDVYIKSDSPSNNKEQTTFPEHNCSNIFKYLSYCMGLCPRAYSDHELLLLLTLVGRVGLDTRLILQSSVELFPLQYKIVNNIRDWDNMLPKICLALTDLTDDHHNMCLLVQLLPDNTRGKQLRRHLSLSMISKLLDGNCTYKPTEKEFQLSMLRPYLPRMQPSTLLRSMTSSRSQKDKEEDMVTLDQQAYYLCYSLLTLANESSNFQFFPAHQKEQLLCLCSELETHVKCDIRESEKCLYRSKVKDLVARIYTKWQMVLQRTRPLHGKLYDYWQPVLVDTLVGSQEGEVEEDDDIHNSDNEEDTAVEENPVMEEDEQEETNEAAESEVVMTAEDSEEEKEDEAEELNMKLDEKMAETGDDPKDDKNETKEACEPAPEDLNQEMPEKETEVQEESPVMDEQTDTDNLELPEADDTKQSSYQTEAAACGSVS